MAESVSISAAKAHLGRLIERAQQGEEIIVRRGVTPVARIVAYQAPTAVRRPGALKGQIKISDDLDEPPSEFANYTDFDAIEEALGFLEREPEAGHLLRDGFGVCAHSGWAHIESSTSCPTDIKSSASSPSGTARSRTALTRARWAQAGTRSSCFTR